MARLRGRAYLELGEHRDPIGGEPPPRSADGVRETNSRGRYSGRRTASARRSLSARARPDATRRLPRARQSTRDPRPAAKRLQGGASHGRRVFSLVFCEHSYRRDHVRDFSRKSSQIIFAARTVLAAKMISTLGSLFSLRVSRNIAARRVSFRERGPASRTPKRVDARADRRRERAVARAHPSAWRPTIWSIAPWKSSCRACCACMPLSVRTAGVFPLPEHDGARRARDGGTDPVLSPAPPPPPSAPTSRSAKPLTWRSTTTAATRCSSRRSAVERLTRRKA
jgi:hypothetical protein